MNLVISLAAEYGTDLSSRHKAVECRLRILDAAAESQERVEINMTDVRTLSDSFADELFGILVVEQGDDWFKRHVLVSHLPQGLRWTILNAIQTRLNRSSQPPELTSLAN